MPVKEKHDKYQRALRYCLSSVWLFPGLLFIAVVLLTAGKLSGTSVGIYFPIFYGPNQTNHNLLYGAPQPIRSDEWLYVTQMTIAQHNAGYPRFNPNIDYGRDMSVVGDAPYKDWSAIFRPQNFAFFVMPLEYAFAFKWWLLLCLTIMGGYFLLLRFLASKRLLAAVLSTAFGLSPFLFWWYQTATMAPLFYGFFIILISLRIIDGEHLTILKARRMRYSLAVYTLVLAYLLISFALILYPPFQIPVVLVTLSFLAGYILDKYGFSKKLLSGAVLKMFGVFVASALLASIIILIFLHTRAHAVSAVEHSVYPGNRIVAAGGASPLIVLSSFLDPQLQRFVRALHFYTNQSEASNFILYTPFLLIPGFMVILKEYRIKKMLNYTLLLTQLVACLFLINMFIPGLSQLYHLLLLTKVQHARLLLGLGFVGFLQLMLIMKSISRLPVPGKVRLLGGAALYSFFCMLALLITGGYVRGHYPLFIHSWPLIFLYALIFVSVIFCMLSRRFLIGASILLFFTVVSVYKIHPIYRGLSPLYPAKLTSAIEYTSQPGDTWVALDNIWFENFAIMGNRNSLSGIQLYPNLHAWDQAEGQQDRYIYNRYAHVIFNSTPNFSGALHLSAPDSFQVKFSCTPFIEHNVQYALAVHTLADSCVTKVGEVHYPATTFYLYKVH